MLWSFNVENDIQFFLFFFFHQTAVAAAPTLVSRSRLLYFVFLSSSGEACSSRFLVKGSRLVCWSLARWMCKISACKFTHFGSNVGLARKCISEGNTHFIFQNYVFVCGSKDSFLKVGPLTSLGKKKKKKNQGHRNPFSSKSSTETLVQKIQLWICANQGHTHTHTHVFVCLSY